MQTHFIIFNDDSCTNTINMLALSKAFPEARMNIVSFTNPAEGITYLWTQYANHPVPAVLLLDANMLQLSARQVIQQVETLPLSALAHLQVYILSGAAILADIQKANTHHLVKGVLPKPVSASLPLILTASEKKELFYAKAPVLHAANNSTGKKAPGHLSVIH